MADHQRDIPELPPAPELPWHPVVGPARERYQQARRQHIEDLAVVVGEVLSQHFPDLATEDPEMAEALVLRWATGLSNQFEKGVQEGIFLERKRQLKLGHVAIPKTVTGLGGYG